MRVVIDMQGVQCSNSKRGIGRLSLSLVKAIIVNRGDHEVILALNGLFPDTIEFIRASFDGLIPQENIRIWQTPGPVGFPSEANIWRRAVAELLRESFFASLNPDIVLLSSLFEGWGDDAVTSIGMFTRALPTAVILYDLIPFIHRSLYLDNPAYESWYEQKLGHLRRADLLLAISESTRQEVCQHLGVFPDMVVNISAAADAHFAPQPLDFVSVEQIRERYGISRPFVLYTGGIDHRKNVEGLIRAYAKLPQQLRELHQLAVVCSIQPHDRARLMSLARKWGLKNDAVVLTGFVPDEDLVALYSHCEVFVFPSWHEGFGLPVLEAMRCGAAVIGANATSIPEVIGRSDALFDPHNEQTITAKITQVLTDDVFRSELKRHALERASRFSWDRSAKRVISALETLNFSRHDDNRMPQCEPVRRPKLAYVSPLPPERSGISDYSAELLPELALYYQIDVIVAQDVVSDPWINANCPIRDVSWFRHHASEYDRVVYHFGNSSYHQHMFDLLENVQGTVVLHDFFLSGIISYLEGTEVNRNVWGRELYYSHGYRGVHERFIVTDTSAVVWKYPCNLRVLQSARGVIVHSEYSRRLARRWYPDIESERWAVISHLRVPMHEEAAERLAARNRNKMAPEADFVVCSFGMIGPNKLNHRLLRSWLSSRLARDRRCVLVFVGENHNGDYGQKLLEVVRKSGLDNRIRITGWVDAREYRRYLDTADMAVQLRTLSRGESSGTVLDCMNYGVPTIVNAHGSLADVPDEGVWKLPDEFDDEQLVEAMEHLWEEEGERRKLGQKAQEVIRRNHSPRDCARLYHKAIEGFHSDALLGTRGLIDAVAKVDSGNVLDDRDYAQIATAVSHNQVHAACARTLFIDVSELVRQDVGSGIQRVTKSILKELLGNPPGNYRVEPVYATFGTTGYRYARHFTLDFLGCSTDLLGDDVLEFRVGDVFLGLDLQQQIVPDQQDFLAHMRRVGVRVYFTVYDLLPVRMPHAFPPGADVGFETWLRTITQFDGAICISQAVADDLRNWLVAQGEFRRRPFEIMWTHIGVDLVNSFATDDLSRSAADVLADLSGRRSFLMVGTIEPRKGHAQVLSAIELLWGEGMDVSLVIVGKQGWMVEPLIERLRSHPELGKRLVWLGGISDAYLERIYSACSCLIEASEGEGFGLPLVEAAQHKLPIIARDIPVFREVAGDHAFYFGGKDPSELARAISSWIDLYGNNKYPRSDEMPWLTWKEVASNLLEIIGCQDSSAGSSLNDQCALREAAVSDEIRTGR